MGSNNRVVDPNVKDFLILNGVVLTLVLFYLLRRRPRSGMRLSLKSGQVDGAAQASGAGSTISIGSKSPVESEVLEDEPAQRRTQVGKSLNVIFNYNGHSWDAYEVLGLPAGSSIEKVKAAFEESLAQVDPESRVFIETAYRAIVAHLKS
ncbi:MAG: hypothetical protein H6624_08580 [Bdellovibrionaceae bacterium]|nr:hypothetical protein [Bdellovibrionales bacterium]MCB9084388.1 hypothetical protein [Pseudobdellovibrionaceae bacterium]